MDLTKTDPQSGSSSSDASISMDTDLSDREPNC